MYGNSSSLEILPNSNMICLAKNQNARPNAFLPRLFAGTARSMPVRVSSVSNRDTTGIRANLASRNITLSA